MEVQKPTAKVPSKLLVDLNNIYIMLRKEHRNEAEWMLANAHPQTAQVITHCSDLRLSRKLQDSKSYTGILQAPLN